MSIKRNPLIKIDAFKDEMHLVVYAPTPSGLARLECYRMHAAPFCACAHLYVQWAVDFILGLKPGAEIDFRVDFNADPLLREHGVRAHELAALVVGAEVAA